MPAPPLIPNRRLGKSRVFFQRCFPLRANSARQQVWAARRRGRDWWEPAARRVEGPPAVELQVARRRAVAQGQPQPDWSAVRAWTVAIGWLGQALWPEPWTLRPQPPVARWRPSS